jgi:hypothetical protein
VILAVAKTQPHTLFGFMKMPGVTGSGGILPVAGELDVSALIDVAPLLQLPVMVEG